MHHVKDGQFHFGIVDHWLDPDACISSAISVFSQGFSIDRILELVAFKLIMSL